MCGNQDKAKTAQKNPKDVENGIRLMTEEDPDDPDEIRVFQWVRKINQGDGNGDGDGDLAFDCLTL